jgi:hypothetical protein
MGVMLAALAAMAGPTAASALEPGVRVDPGSPAAKEYALPLEQARQSAVPGSSTKATLFGAGIKPPGGSSGGGSRGSSGTGASPRSGASAARPRGGPASLDPVLPSAALPAASSHNDGSTLALLGGGVAVLILGGFGGTVLRHNRRPSSSP